MIGKWRGSALMLFCILSESCRQDVLSKERTTAGVYTVCFRISMMVGQLSLELYEMYRNVLVV